MRIKDFIRPLAPATNIVLVDSRTNESEPFSQLELIESPKAERGFWSAKVIDGTLVLMTTPSRTETLPLKEYLRGDFATYFEISVMDAEGNSLFKGNPRNVPADLLSRRVRSMSTGTGNLEFTLAVKFRTVWVSPSILAVLDRAMQKEPASERECFGESDTFTCTADFGGGVEADVKCCGVRYWQGESNLAWAEAVLFKDGAECCCSEVEDTFEGRWELALDGTEYIIDVKASSQDGADYVVT